MDAESFVARSVRPLAGCVAACALGVIAAGDARAAEPPASAHASPASPAEAPAEQGRLYGWQNIVVAYGGALVAVHGLFVDSPLIVFTGAATWTFGGAAVHAAHGNGAAAVASPFLQVGGPVLLGLLGYGLGGRRDGDDYAAAFAFAGALAAPLVDGLVLGRERPKSPPRVGLAPLGAGLALVGAF